MCGIFGVLCPGGLQLSDDSLNELVGKISYRGPDEISVDRLSEYCALGHCRLSIMDVAGGSQPMYSPDGSIAVTLNGEIYNFPSLRKQLEGEYTFRTRCDTEVLIPLVRLLHFAPVLYLYLLWLIACRIVYQIRSHVCYTFERNVRVCFI